MKKIIAGGLLALGLVVATTISAGTALQAQTVTEAKCALAKQRLEVRMTKVEATQTAITTVYMTASGKVTDVTASADAAGYDTKDMIAAGTTVTAKITAFTTSADAYKDALAAAQKASCTDNGAAFITSLIAARTALTETRTASLAVRTAFTGEAIPALKAYAAWLKSQANGEETAQ